MPNRLAAESSPYLLQHAANPVDWYPWGDEALARARAEGKPIFLSIGYSACHWCHVMEHESFENPRIAALLNENFVCIKVDREERPELDQIYMNAVQLMTGRGGWPMSVFLTPEGKPFYGGTYWPPQARMGMPGFDQVLSAVVDAWQHRRAQALEQAESLSDHIQLLAVPQGPPSALDETLVERAAAALLRAFDTVHGGFGGAPKFPHPMDLQLLAGAWFRQRDGAILHAMTFTLDKMAAGGIYDQLGGGFHRYSVDERWLVPHFEKMLYDNALLVPCYTSAYLMTRNAEYARVAHETCGYVLREMTDPAGGFYSTQDADSEGEEGKYFLWTPQAIEEVLGTQAAQTFCLAFDVTERGNFEHGKSILNRPLPITECARSLGRDPQELEQELASSRARLLAARSARVAPGLDDKVLVAWNGLMIHALCVASGALDEPRYLKAAARAADFILKQMRRADGRLLHSWRRGVARLDAYLDDYACLVNALVSLYEADFKERWIDEAVSLADLMLRGFADRDGGFFFTAADHETLITRPKDLFDNATPSGNSMAAMALLRLGKLTGSAECLSVAEATLRTAAHVMRQSPAAVGQLLLALDLYWGPAPEIVVVGDPENSAVAAVLAAIRQRFIPNKVLAGRRGDAPAAENAALAGLLAGKGLPDGETVAVYVCEGFACRAPLVGREAAIAGIEALSAPPAAGKPE